MRPPVNRLLKLLSHWNPALTRPPWMRQLQLTYPRGVKRWGLVNPGVRARWLLIVAGVGIFCGCVGKSAQFPLHTWLPDAMEGPTPVSALVHSATMVAAGVFLVARFYPVFLPEVLFVIAVVGTVTLFMAATIAIVATDIKRVLAYSTVSQLGYMMLALGVGGWLAGVMHLFTHAFFKSLLFMCSGSVIHAVHTNEMPEMGGLRKKMPWTAYTMLIGCLAIAGAGVPFAITLFGIDIGGLGFSGYYSKDAILEQALSFKNTNPGWGTFFFVAAAGGRCDHGVLHVSFVVPDVCGVATEPRAIRPRSRITAGDVFAAGAIGDVGGIGGMGTRSGDRGKPCGTRHLCHHSIGVQRTRRSFARPWPRHPRWCGWLESVDDCHGHRGGRYGGCIPLATVK